MLIFIADGRNGKRRSWIIQIHLMLIFISLTVIFLRTWLGIQIHLMLIFIDNPRVHMDSDYHSNTSHVNLYRIRRTYHSSDKQIQIHLLLIFIKPDAGRPTSGRRIQIHLMLIFISTTISAGSKPCKIQIHLMLIFILWLFVCNIPRAVIQIHLMLIFIKRSDQTQKYCEDSNTSHVNLYPLWQEVAE